MSRTEQTFELLRKFESRNIFHEEKDPQWPIVWDRAKGVWVWDIEGKKYLDLTSAFGVAAAGHANTEVVEAATQQMHRLLHGMGDVHPHEVKAKLLEQLSRITFERWTHCRKIAMEGKSILGSSGFEAVEAALKTAFLATGEKRVIAFKGGYHGLGYGALSTTHRKMFRDPFRDQLRRFGSFVTYPQDKDEEKTCWEEIEKVREKEKIGAVLIEPIQGRGGIKVPHNGFFGRLRKFCDEQGIILIADEIYTGFGRTGDLFAVEHENVVPDIVCLGKALTGGFPLSACVGESDLMDRAWPESTGEAIHTSTYLGHPVGCAMALAQIEEVEERGLAERAQERGAWLKKKLSRIPSQVSNLKLSVRGRGLMIGIEVRNGNDQPATDVVIHCMKQMLGEGFIILPEGDDSEVISLAPPLVVTEGQLGRAVDALGKILISLGEPGEAS